MRAVKTVSTKFNGDCGGHLMEYGMAPQVYNRMVEQLGGDKPGTEVFASRDIPQLRKCTRHLHKGESAWSKHWGLKDLGAHVLAWRSRRHQAYGEQDYCG